ncbi:hypothetical protein PNEG_03332 [Pneumocystis murina B123]|uniref:Major surface glycoprotein 2 C-terminal domain-containing protein n=1 Tax=Pneumocystis murina (strain B123) TaxID=1069680 RepID=M7NLT6_PNEMU|nr:hypothetical protein PNEG_03332 [Pneumocystis murina B123]EMR08157.2 hypothetical protein PNEG_03332 [Pneumocystis murina B123]
MLQNAKLLELLKIREFKRLRSGRLSRNFDGNYFGDHPGVDYFRKDDYDFFFPKDYPQDNQWVKEAIQKGAVMARSVKRQAAEQVAKDEIKGGTCFGFNCENELKNVSLELKNADPKKKVEKESKDLKKELLEAFKNIKDEDCRKYEDKCIFLEEADPINLKENRVKIKRVYEILFGNTVELVFSCLNPNVTCQRLKSRVEDVCTHLGRILNENELEEKCQEYLENCYFYKSNCGSTKYNIILEKIYEKEEVKGIISEKLQEKSLENIILLLSKEKNRKSLQEICKNVLNDCDFLYMNYHLKELSKEASKNIDSRCKELVKVETRYTNLKLELYLKELSTEFEKNKDSKYFSWEQVPKLPSKEDCIKFESECFYLENVCTNKIDKACENVRIVCYRKGQNRVFNKLIQNRLISLNYLKSYEVKLKECKELMVKNCIKFKGDKRYFLKCHRPTKLCYEFLEDIIDQSKEFEALLDSKRDFPKGNDCFKLIRKCHDLRTYSHSNNDRCTTLNIRCEYLEVREKFKKRFLERKDDSLKTKENCIKALKEECERLSRGKKNPFVTFCALPEETCNFIVKEVIDECYNLAYNMNDRNIINKIEKTNKALTKEICMFWDPYCHQYIENCPEILKQENINTKRAHCLKLQRYCTPLWENLRLEGELIHELKSSLINDTICKETLEKYYTKWKSEKNQTFDSASEDKNGSSEHLRRNVCKKLIEKVKRKCSALKNELDKEKDELKEKNEYEKVKKEAENFMKVTNLLLSKPKKNENGQSATLSVQNNSVLAPVAPSTAPPTAAESASSQGGTEHTTEQRLILRRFVDEGVSKTETNAFDLMTRALKLYLGMKEDCKTLQVNCGFRENCLNFGTVCEDIDKLCNVKPLEVIPHHTLILTTISTATRTATMPNNSDIDDNVTTSIKEAATEQCTLIRTINTSVIDTSLHTSTMTSTSAVTSTVTLTSMQECKPTRCTTDSSRKTKMRGKLISGQGMKMRVPKMIKIMLGVIVMRML